MIAQGASRLPRVCLSIPFEFGSHRSGSFRFAGNEVGLSRGALLERHEP